MMHTIEDYLKHFAQETPDKVAVAMRAPAAGMTSRLTYAQLYQQALALAAELKTECPQRSAGTNLSGLKSKTHSRADVFRATQDISFLVRYFALHLAGRVAVPLEGDAPEERTQQVLGMLEQSPIPEETADILFTTGTTGRSKGVLISHRAILCNAENLVCAQGFTAQHVFVITGPLNHIGSLSKVYPVIMTGGTLLITSGMKDLGEFFDALEYPCSKMATFLPPANIRILLQFARQRLEGYRDKIDFVETGAAPLSQADMDAFCRLLPHSRLYNTYASTETGIISTHNYNGSKCQAGCLGHPMKHARLHITPEGKVACQGPTLMSGYLGDEALTRTVLRDGTLYTSDNGYIDEEGMLVLTGRDDDVINSGGFKISPTEVENVALSCPGVADCVCISAPHPVLGNAPRLLVVLEPGVKLNKRQMALYLNEHLERYKVPVFYQQVESVNRTFNGKIDRKSYRNNPILS